MNETLIKDLRSAFENFGNTRMMHQVEVAECKDFTEVLLTYNDEGDNDNIGIVRISVSLQITSPTDYSLLWYATDGPGTKYVVCLGTDDIRFIALVNALIRAYERS